MKTIALYGASALAFSLLACGGGAGAPAAVAPTSATPGVDKDTNEVATGNTLTDFQKKRLLGHYSTSDGATGFILDRTVTPWRAKLDGVNKHVTLAESNKPRRGETEYTSEDKSVWIRIDEEGNVLLFQGPKQREGVRVTRDADAQQLK
jgi:hypothetical protein